jgi:peptide/nickel transport system substrate-binding protein
MPALRRRARLVVLFLALGAAAACSDGSAPRSDRDPDRFGGTVVVAANSDLEYMNSLVSSDRNTQEINRYLLFLPLIGYSADLDYEPALAERWELLGDTGVVFHLRRDVRWHDGVPTTAEDVRFTYERMRDPAVGFPRVPYLQHWSPEVVVVDSFTISFRLRAHAEFLDFWTWDVAKPAHLLRDVPPGDLRNHPLGHEPIGNGPFRFLRRVPGRELVFEANPDFPEALGGRPYLDRVIFRVVPDATARLTELLTGGTDIVMLGAEQVRRVGDERRLRLIEYPHSAWTQIIWNTRRPPFDDARVRRALSLAIDRAELIAGVLQGQGRPGRWTATPTHWQYDDDPDGEPRHDPAEARRLLAEAGWHDRNGDGILQNEHGRALRFTVITYRGSSIHAQTLPALQAQLRRVGVDLQMRLLEQATALALVEGRVNDTGERVRDFDALLTNWETGLSSDDSWFLHSRHRNAPLAAASYGDVRADSLMDLLATMVDREAARPIWREYQQYMVQESPVTVLYYPKHVVAVADRLRDVEMVVAGPFVTAPRWWLLPGGRRR